MPTPTPRDLFGGPRRARWIQIVGSAVITPPDLHPTARSEEYSRGDRNYRLDPRPRRQTRPADSYGSENMALHVGLISMGAHEGDPVGYGTGVTPIRPIHHETSSDFDFERTVPRPPAGHPLTWRGTRCADLDPEAFFPGSGLHPEARRACLECPFRVPCLEWAIAHNESGYWGGTTGAQRAKIKRARAEGLDNEANPMV